MKIALIATLDSLVAKNSVGGTEIWTYNYYKQLTSRGHDVTLFASSDSQIDGKLVSVCKSSDLVEETTGKISLGRLAYFSNKQMAAVIDRQDEFDLIHLSVYSLSFYLGVVDLIRKPLVVTVHGMSMPKDEAAIVLSQSIEANFVLPSEEFLRKWVTPTKYKIINHGINLEDFPFDPTGGENYFWMGRITPDKGIIDAIEFAKRTNSKLIIAGPKRDPEFFQQQVEPKLNTNINYIGELGAEEKVKYYQQAKAFLMPTKCEEAFGLVAVESLACGTPVIAYRKGALPDLITNGVDGFLVEPDSVVGLINAAEKISSIDRQKCRDKVEKKYSIDLMVDNYIEHYQSIIDKNI